MSEEGWNSYLVCVDLKSGLCNMIPCIMESNRYLSPVTLPCEHLSWLQRGPVIAESAHIDQTFNPDRTDSCS